MDKELNGEVLVDAHFVMEMNYVFYLSLWIPHKNALLFVWYVTDDGLSLSVHVTGHGAPDPSAHQAAPRCVYTTL